LSTRFAVVVVAVLAASAPARADRGTVRLGGTFGYQQTDRAAWVLGPSLEVNVTDRLGIRGEAHLELGDFTDPFGPSNIRGGDGPHVNHVMFGPTWRPRRYAAYNAVVGASAGVLVMHSIFSAEHFVKRPAAGAFVQAGTKLGPAVLSVQLRLDVSTSVAMAGPAGESVPTTSGRLNFAFEFPFSFR
jgi:hypothetical protein